MAHKLITYKIREQVFKVYKIQDIFYYERLFCIFEKKNPFELKIKYKELSNETEVNPVFAGGHLGFSTSTITKTSKDYYFRIETREECERHVHQINEKKI